MTSRYPVMTSDSSSFDVFISTASELEEMIFGKRTVSTNT
jgi:hypothetical protein